MKIGIIGSGIVGQVLAKAFIAEGNQVMLGTRNVSKEEVVKFKSENSTISIGTFAEAALFGELLVICTKGSVAEEAIKLAGIENFTGKVVIDTTNPIAAAPPVNGVLQYFTGPNESLMERLQALIPKAKLVKAFSSAGNNTMYKPNFSGGIPSMFIAGNDAEAKKIVATILTSFGWEAEDMGMAEAARPLNLFVCYGVFQAL